MTEPAKQRGVFHGNYDEEGYGMADDKVHLSRKEARAGASTHVTRYVLPISLVLVVVLFAGVLFLWR